MLLEMTSIRTGKRTVRELPITKEQLDRFNRGENVQKVFPHLSASDREWLMNGTTDEEWNEMFPGEDEDKK